MSKTIQISKQADKTINIYPNPTNGKVFLQTSLAAENLTLRVFNQLGQLVLVSKGLEVDMSGLASGVYEVVVGEVRQRVVRE